MGIETTLIVHASLVPVFAFLIALLYFKKFGQFEPLVTAAIFTGFVITLDAGLVAPVFEKSFAMFRSILGTWIPFGLIFFSTLVTGLVSGRRRHRGPSEIAPGVYWYSTGAIAGNVYFVQSGSSWVLIDTATAGQAARIRDAAAALFGASRPAAILLTHVHPDHSGSALELARAWHCPVYLHPGEFDLAVSRNLATVAKYANALDRWIIMPLLRLFPRRWLETKLEQQSLKEVARVFEPDADPPGLSDWTSITTPGHSPGHTAFIRQADRVLVSGDALLTVDAGSLRGVLSWISRPNRQRICGPPWYTNWDRAMATTSAATLVRLQPRVLAPGHGLPWSGEAAASLVADATGEKKDPAKTPKTED